MSFERTTAHAFADQAHPESFRYAAVQSDSGNDGVATLPWAAENGPSKSEVEQREMKAREAGRKEGETWAATAFEQQLVLVRESVRKAIEEFKAQRETYFSRIEPEVVQLALAIARKILHREAQMDPLLLAGMVHVALEKLDSGTRVRMRGNPGDIRSWNESFSQAGVFQRPPEVVGDATLQPGECAIETEIGSTVISLDVQLKEIEQGFFDLLEQRPRVR